MANKLYEPFKYDIESKYGEIIRLTLVTMYFSYIVPIVSVLGVLAIISISHMYYCILIYYSKRPIRYYFNNFI